MNVFLSHVNTKSQTQCVFVLLACFLFIPGTSATRIIVFCPHVEFGKWAFVAIQRRKVLHDSTAAAKRTTRDQHYSNAMMAIRHMVELCFLRAVQQLQPRTQHEINSTLRKLRIVIVRTVRWKVEANFLELLQSSFNQNTLRQLQGSGTSREVRWFFRSLPARFCLPKKNKKTVHLSRGRYSIMNL